MAVAIEDAEIRHLAALVAIAGERSARMAARRLGGAPSTLTQQLVELEQATGAPLIEPGSEGRSDRLTDAGRLLLDRAQAVVEHVAAARADLEALSIRPSLRVGVCDAVGMRVVDAILRAQPDTSILPRLGHDDAELVVWVEHGSADLCLVSLTSWSGPLEFVRLLDEPSAGRPVALAWHRYRRLPPEADRFRRAAVSEAPLVVG